MNSNSQLRKHLRFTWREKLRAWLLGRRLAYVGNRVFIEKNVKFLRFPKNISIGNDVVVKEGARICSCNENAKITIGARTTIGYHTFIFSSQEITIGNDCLIAPFVYIVDSNHGIGRHSLINQQQNETAPVRIGNDVWIAGNVTILKGVTIADGAVIAANSVVNDDVPAYAVYGGSPSRKIGERN